MKTVIEYREYVAWGQPGNPIGWVVDCGACHYKQDDQAPIADEATAEQTATSHRARNHPELKVRKVRLDRRTRQERELREARA